MIKNHGIDWKKELAEQSDEDWEFGAAFVPDKAQIPEAERVNYLPKGEVQRGIEDMMDCATRGPNNKIEAKMNFLLRNGLLKPETVNWIRDFGYINNDNDFESSDAFIAILSGTTKTGNSLKAPLSAMENFGLIPKRMLPLEQWMTWDDYHNPNRITQAMKDLGQEFRKRIRINYQKVYEHEYRDLIKQDFLVVAGSAWPVPENGVYPRVESTPNHVWINFEGYWKAFDNYIDSFDGDFIKQLAPNYDFLDYGYRVTINEEKVIPAEYGCLKKLWISFRRHLGL